MIVIIIIVYFYILYISICMVLLNPMLHGITISYCILMILKGIQMFYNYNNPGNLTFNL